MKLLVVDDDPVATRMLSDVLETHGHEVDHAKDWLEMMRALNAARYQAVFLDDGLPGVKGSTLVCQVCVISTETRVVLFSGLEEAKLAELAREVGADGYLAKSRGVQYAPQILRRVLLSAERRRALSVTNPLQGGAPAGCPAPGYPTTAEAEEEPVSSAPPACPGTQASIPVVAFEVPAKSACVPEFRAPEESPESSIPPWEAYHAEGDAWLPDVILVDRNGMRRREQEAWFFERGFGIHGAGEVEAGVRVLQDASPRPDILVLSGSGAKLLEDPALRSLRADARWKDLVVILVDHDEPGVATSAGSGLGIDQVLRGDSGRARLPQVLANRVRMLQWLRRLREARERLGGA